MYHKQIYTLQNDTMSLSGIVILCLPACLPACLPTYLPTYLPTHLPRVVSDTASHVIYGRVHFVQSVPKEHTT